MPQKGMPQKGVHRQGLQQLFDELSAALVLYARQWCDFPDDAVQEAFIDLANCGDVPDSPKAWLYTTTRRKAQNIARSEVRRRYHQQQAGEQRSNASQSPTNWFAKASDAAVPAESVMHGLDALASDERELVVAKIWGELNFEQLAELLSCSVSSAHRRYNTALANLKMIVANSSSSAEERKAEASPASPLQQTPLRENRPQRHTQVHTQASCQQAADRHNNRASANGVSAKTVDGELR